MDHKRNNKTCSCCHRETCPGKPTQDDDEGSSLKSSNPEQSDKETQKTASENSNGTSEYRNATIDMKGVYNSMEDPKLFRGCLMHMAVLTKDLVSVIRESKATSKKEKSQNDLMEQDLFFGPLNFEIPIEIRVEEDDNKEFQEIELNEMNIGDKNFKFKNKKQPKSFEGVENVPKTLNTGSLQSKDIFYSCESLTPNDQTDFVDINKKISSVPKVSDQLSIYKKTTSMEQVSDKHPYSKSNTSMPDVVQTTRDLKSKPISEPQPGSIPIFKSVESDHIEQVNIRKPCGCIKTISAKQLPQLEQVDDKPPSSKPREDMAKHTADITKSSASVGSKKKKPCSCRKATSAKQLSELEQVYDKPPSSKSREIMAKQTADITESLASVGSSKKKPCSCRKATSVKQLSEPSSKSKEDMAKHPADITESLASVGSSKKKPCSCVKAIAAKYMTEMEQDYAKPPYMESLASVISSQKKPCVCHKPKAAKQVSEIDQADDMTPSTKYRADVPKENADITKSSDSIGRSKKKPCTCPKSKAAKQVSEIDQADPSSKPLSALEQGYTKTGEAMPEGPAAIGSSKQNVDSLKKEPCVCVTEGIDGSMSRCRCKKSKSEDVLLQTKLPHSSRESVIKCNCAQRQKTDSCQCGREKVALEDLPYCTWSGKQGICGSEKCACDIAHHIVAQTQGKKTERKGPIMYRLAFPQHKDIEVCIKCRFDPSPLLDENDQVFCPGNCGCCLCAWKPRATRSLEDVLLHQKVKVCKCRKRSTIFTDFVKVGSACSQVSYFDLCPCREKTEARYLELYDTEMWDKNEKLKNLKNDQKIYLSDVREIRPATQGNKSRFMLSRMYNEL